MKFLQNNGGFIGIAALILMAAGTAAVGTAAYLDGRVNFSLIKNETPEAVSAAGEQAGRMAERMTDQWTASMEMMNRMAMEEREAMRWEMMQSEASHRATMEKNQEEQRGLYALVLAILSLICGALLFAVFSALRHPSRHARTPAQVGQAEMYQLDDGRVMLIDGNGHRLIQAPRVLHSAMIRNERGGADPALLTTLIGCIGIAFVVILIASGDPSPTITAPDNTGEIRMMAEQLHADSMAQIDRMAGYLMQANQDHVSSLRTFAGRGADVMAYILIGALVLIAAVGGMILILLRSGKMTIAPQKEREVVYLVSDQFGDLHRVDNPHVEQIPMDRYQELPSPGKIKLLSNQRGNGRLFIVLLILFICSTGLLAYLLLNYNSLSAGGSYQQTEQRESNSGQMRSGAIKAVTLCFMRNPNGGEPIRRAFMTDYEGNNYRIKDEERIRLALEAISQTRPEGYRPMKGGIR